MTPRRTAAAVLLLVVAALLQSGAASAAPTQVLVQCVPAPSNCNQWYRGPVTVKWTLPLATDVQLGTCVSPQTLQADTPGKLLSCIAWEGDPLSGKTTVQVLIRVDATPPAVTATPDRPPDHGIWFNHPVGINFHGSDATSGVAACDTASYGGPEGAAVSVAGSCRDLAGNVGGGSLALNYDATPPPAPRAAVRPGNGSVKLDWSAASDVEAVEVTRFARAAAPTVVFDGQEDDAFTDKRLHNGARYRYAVTAMDRAGNRAQTLVSAVPTRSRLLGPARGARLAAAPLLLWKPVKRAAYYNVQLYRGGRKVLSSWPVAAKLQLKPSWRFQGQRRRLVPGRYRWLVWPGFGKRSERRYGKQLGASAFTVVR